MAINPPLIPGGGMPVVAPGEMFLVQRTGIGFKLETPGVGKMSASGSLFMTTRRITFVCGKVTTTRGITLAAFDLPYSCISGEKFNQPIFGANYLSGIVQPVPGMGLPQAGKFRLVFNDGGVGTFLRFFFLMMDQARRTAAAMAAASAVAASAATAPPVWSATPPAFVESVRTGEFARQQRAYVDPTDPTTLFIAQPAGTVVGDVPYMGATPVVAPASGGAPGVADYGGYSPAVYDGSAGAGGAGTYAEPAPVPVATVVSTSATPPAAAGTAPPLPPGLGEGTGAPTAARGPPPGLHAKGE